jgi:2-polyprenyl-6-methoxyphenol hydroxylase-like FAD-dependent oxidoreductase
VHRSALQKCLVKGAEASGVVQLHLNKIVEEYDVDSTSFVVRDRKIKNGGLPAEEVVHADVILASDGVKSKARSVLMKRNGEFGQSKSTRRRRRGW